MNTTIEPGDMMPDSGAGAPRGKRASSRGRLLIGAVLLVAVVAAAAAVFLLFGQSDSPDEGAPVALSTPSAAAADASATAAPATTSESVPAPPEVALDEVFTFRDIFVPLVKAETSSETASETSSTSDGTPETSEGTILLQDITVENGEPTAVLVWDGKTYSAQEGDQIDDSPWKVLEIGSDSVVMLYGDTQVVLSVGQQVTK